MLVSERSQLKNYRFVSLACRLSSQQVTSVLISAFELVPYKNEERGAGNEHEEQENESWDQNLT